MIGDCIIQTREGQYQTFMICQGGTVFIGQYPCEELAKEAWVNAQISLNDRVCESSDCPLFLEMEPDANGESSLVQVVR